jgi:hypothetical protein
MVACVVFVAQAVCVAHARHGVPVMCRGRVVRRGGMRVGGSVPGAIEDQDHAEHEEQ